MFNLLQQSRIWLWGMLQAGGVCCRAGGGWHNALKVTVNRKPQKTKIWQLPTLNSLSGQLKFTVKVLPCHSGDCHIAYRVSYGA